MGELVWLSFEGWRLAMEGGGNGWCDGGLRVWVWGYEADELLCLHSLWYIVIMDADQRDTRTRNSKIDGSSTRHADPGDITTLLDQTYTSLP